MRTGLVLLLAGGLFGLPGCSATGPERVEVSGTVRLDGQLVDDCSIRFIPTDGTVGPEAGATISNGRYHISRAKGVAVGKNRIKLLGFRSSGRKVIDPNAPPGTLTEERVPLFPPQFNERSTLVREIHPGSNTVNLDLQSTPTGQ